MNGFSGIGARIFRVGQQMALAAVLGIMVALGVPNVAWAVVDLSVAVSSTPSSVTPGVEVAFDIVAANAGTEALQSETVYVVVRIPPQLTIQSHIAPPDWSCVTPSPDILSCAFPALAVGQSATLRLQARLGSAVGRDRQPPYDHWQWRPRALRR